MFLGSAISNIVLVGSVATNLSYLTVFEIVILIPNPLKLIATNIMETTDKILKLLRNCNCWAKIRIMHVLKVQKTIELSGSGDTILNNYLLILVLFGSEIKIEGVGVR